ncbi:MAG: LysM peptidoglycan-binding domain-containing protein [Croceivirga sp.]
MRLLVLIGVVLIFDTAFGQQRYATHPVKEGETIYSIAKQYRVTPYSILKENPEVKTAEEIQPNTLLVIPVGKDYRGEFTTKTTEKKIVSVQPRQMEPIGYIKHRVKKRETLFSLTQRYDVTEEQIKRYNKALYSEELKKGMVLQIPEYPEMTPEEERALDFETYVVLPKETRWSIANKYGITVDSLLQLNPDLPKNSAYLAAGQELLLPRPKGDSLKDQEVAIFESFTVPKAMGLFRVSQNYGISVDSVIKLNPEIKEVGGLKEGMVLRLPKRLPDNEVVNTENYIFYEVKPKQNIFRMTRNLKISSESMY